MGGAGGRGRSSEGPCGTWDLPGTQPNGAARGTRSPGRSGSVCSGADQLRLSVGAFMSRSLSPAVVLRSGAVVHWERRRRRAEVRRTPGRSLPYSRTGDQGPDERGHRGVEWSRCARSWAPDGSVGRVGPVGRDVGGRVGWSAGAGPAGGCRGRGISARREPERPAAMRPPPARVSARPRVRVRLLTPAHRSRPSHPTFITARLRVRPRPPTPLVPGPRPRHPHRTSPTPPPPPPAPSTLAGVP